MIVLDTNVVSEIMKQEASPQVADWFNQQLAESLYLTTVTLAELFFGIRSLPAGRRRETLSQILLGIENMFRGRILPFDLDAARQFAELATKARKSGRGYPPADGYIGAIAVSRGFVVASRDMAPFAAAGVPVINPWIPPDTEGLKAHPR